MLGYYNLFFCNVSERFEGLLRLGYFKFAPFGDVFLYPCFFTTGCTRGY